MDTAPPDKFVRLLAATAERQRQIAAMQKRHAALTAELIDRPEVIDEILALEVKIAAATQGLRAYQNAADIEREAQEVAQREKDRAAGMAGASALKRKFAARKADHVALQAEAERFVAAVHRFIVGGQELADQTSKAAIAMRGPDTAFRFQAAAAGTSPATVAALATVVRDLITATGGGDSKVGRGRMEQYVEARWSAERLTLTEAGEMNARLLQELFN